MDQAWQLEERFWSAGTTGEVPDYYAHVLTSDAIVVVPGQVLQREELLRQWQDRPPWRDYEITDRRDVLVNGETALLCYQVAATSPDGTVYRARVSSLYTWVTGWALAFRQHTPERDPVDLVPR